MSSCVGKVLVKTDGRLVDTSYSVDHDARWVAERSFPRAFRRLVGAFHRYHDVTREPERVVLPLVVVLGIATWMLQSIGGTATTEQHYAMHAGLALEALLLSFAVADRIQRLEADASVGVAHGQMPPKKLDEVMRDFVSGDLDILDDLTLQGAGAVSAGTPVGGSGVA